MGQILLPKRFHPDFSQSKIKPIGSVEVDWCNPLTSGLHDVFLLDSQNVKSLVHKQSIEYNSATSRRHPQSIGVLASSNEEIFLGNLPLSDWNGASFLILGDLLSSGDAFGRWFGVFVKTGDDIRIFDDTGQMLVAWDDGTFTDTTVGSGTRKDICITHDGTIQTVFEGGGLISSTADTFNFSTVTTGAAYLGTDARNLGLNRSGEFEAVLVFKRAIKLHEYQELVRNPYQVLKPATAQVYNFPSAGGDITINCAAASLTLAGQQATIQQDIDVEIAASAASLTLTGQAAAVTIGNDIAIACSAASLTLTGLGASVQQEVTIECNAASLVLDALAATVTLAGILIEANAAALTLTALPASIQLTTGFVDADTLWVLQNRGTTFSQPHRSSSFGLTTRGTKFLPRGS